VAEARPTSNLSTMGLTFEFRPTAIPPQENQRKELSTFFHSETDCNTM
jgi:hypothetical protein